MFRIRTRSITSHRESATDVEGAAVAFAWMPRMSAWATCSPDGKLRLTGNPSEFVEGAICRPTAMCRCGAFSVAVRQETQDALWEVNLRSDVCRRMVGVANSSAYGGMNRSGEELGGMCSDGGRGVYFASSLAHRLYHCDGDDRMSMFAGSGRRGMTVSDNLRLVSFDGPRGVAVSNGKLVVADTGNSVLRVFDLGSSGVHSAVVGRVGSKEPRDGATGAAGFVSPTFVAADGGVVFVADGWRLRLVDLAAGTVSTVDWSPSGRVVGLAAKSPDEVAWLEET